MDLLQTHTIDCPYCGETIHIMVDCSISEQQYIEDCQVCCRPISLSVVVYDEHVQISAMHEDD